MPAIRLNPDGTPHIHIWICRNRTQSKTYVCDHPDCFSRQHRDNLIGKSSLCGQCKVNKIILDTYNLDLARPRCEECSQRFEARQRRAVKETLKEMGIT